MMLTIKKFGACGCCCLYDEGRGVRKRVQHVKSQASWLVQRRYFLGNTWGADKTHSLDLRCCCGGADVRVSLSASGICTSCLSCVRNWHYSMVVMSTEHQAALNITFQMALRYTAL